MPKSACFQRRASLRTALPSAGISRGAALGQEVELPGAGKRYAHPADIPITAGLELQSVLLCNCLHGHIQRANLQHIL